MSHRSTRWARFARRALAVALVALIVPLTACSGATDATDPATDGSATDEAWPDTIRIGYQIILNGDLVVKNQQLLEQAFGPDVNIEWKLFDSGGNVNQAMASGSLDIGLVGSSPVSRGLSSGIPYQVPWIHDVIGDAESLAVKPGIASLADLKGKTVATPFSSTAHYSLLAALADAGLDSADVNLIDAEPPAILAAWQAGQIDAAYVWNPVLGELLADQGTLLVSSAEMAAKGKTTYDLAVVSEAFATRYPAAVQLWVDQQNIAVEQILAGDPKAYQSIAAEASITAEDAEEQMRGLIYVNAADQASDQYLGQGVADNIYAAAQFNLGLGQITSLLDRSAYDQAVVSAYAAAA
ncbi:MAG: ABC transporter substrate-binding protein [Propionibacteriaceae bacterium]|jgi:taurine transport system substrate-binding protein|nr:ABC transporter substrate-binding protein [Propionibacteriaceae bacterium]